MRRFALVYIEQQSVTSRSPIGNLGSDRALQGIELDFNNENAHRGDADAGEGLAPPVFPF
jgi:hypothetical protein